MTILVDSREQLPLIFTHEYVTETIIMPLPCGDYSCQYKQGWQCPVVFERKTISDLFGTLGKDYERFKREIEKAKELGIQMIIIIEGTLGEVLWGTPHSMRDGISVVRQLFTLWIKYNILPVFCKNRSEMAEYITHYFMAIGRKAMRDLKEQKKKDKNV